MLAGRDTGVYEILRAINASGDGLLGSWALAEHLRTSGLELSEATVGRILRDLDREGLTERLGFRGRRLTAQGKNRLTELESERRLASSGSEFLGALRARTREELLEVLVARRAIERETARLAAHHRTDAQLADLAQALASQAVHVQSGEVATEDDALFHRVIAQAAGNRVLLAANELIRQDSQLTPALEFIRKTLHSTIVADHAKIMEAIRQQDEIAAEQAMVKHIENLIADVRKYYDQLDVAGGDGDGEDGGGKRTGDPKGSARL